MGASLSLSTSVTYNSATQATVKVTLKVTSTSGSWNGDSQYGYITIDGTKYTFHHSFSANTTTTLKTASKTISRTTAAQSIAIKGYYQTGVSAGNISKSASTTVSARPKYTVTFNANGGGTSTSASVFYGYTATFPNISRTGYSLKWGTTSSGGTLYNVGAATPAVTANVTYYAKWTPLTYKVTLNPNGGTSGSVSSLTRTYNQALTIGNNAIPTRPFYDFLGWASSSTATAAQWTTSYPASTSTNAITLYAVWKKAYTPPSVITAETIVRRIKDGVPDQDGNLAQFLIAWTNGKNADGTTAQVTKLKIEYKETLASAWNLLTDQDIDSGESYTYSDSTVFPTSKAYDIRITVDDANTLSAGVPVVFQTFLSKSSYIWRANPDGGVLEFGVPVQCNEELYIKLSCAITFNDTTQTITTSGGSEEDRTLVSNILSVFGYAAACDVLGHTIS